MTPLKNIIIASGILNNLSLFLYSKKFGRDSVSIAEFIYFPDRSSWIIPVRTPVGKVDSLRIDSHFRQNEKDMLPF